MKGALCCRRVLPPRSHRSGDHARASAGPNHHAVLEPRGTRPTRWRTSSDFTAKTGSDDVRFVPVEQLCRSLSERNSISGGRCAISSSAIHNGSAAPQERRATIKGVAGNDY